MPRPGREGRVGDYSISRDAEYIPLPSREATIPKYSGEGRYCSGVDGRVCIDVTSFKAPPLTPPQSTGEGDKKGFTLFEVVLAIGLCGAVMALLAMAIDLYLVRVDTSRTQAETAQLARTLLTKIANDLRAARYSSAAASTSQSFGSAGEASGGGEEAGGQSADTSTAGSTTAADLGIFGTLTELRIDRRAERSWRQVKVPSTEVALQADPRDMPQTVEYFFEQGRTMASSDLAAGGVSVEAGMEGYTGLYRRQSPTATLSTASSNFVSGGTMAESEEVAELLAPEVVQIAFTYSDGTQWYEEWDSSTQEGLPVAVEITVTLFSDLLPTEQPERQVDEEAQRRDSSRWIEYRLLVRIPKIDEPQELSGPPTPSTDEQQPAEREPNGN
jgi:hypothetical protein